jgi:hypothetical protein
MRAICPEHHILLNLVTRMISGETFRLWNSSLCTLHQHSATSSLFGPNITLSTLFSNIHNLCFSLSVTDQVSYPYETKGKSVMMYI